jgi:hypothetical protein
MRRRAFVVGAVTAVFGGCSAREGGAPDATGSNATRTPGTEGGSATPAGTSVPTARATEGGTVVEESVGTAAEHLATAFDELREMRPVGPENVRVSAERFRASDHEVVRRRVDSAATALDGAGSGGEDAPESVRSLRAAVELARVGTSLYAAVRRGFRAEWRFEHHCFDAQWADAAERAGEAERAVDAWGHHGRAVTEAAAAVEAAGGVPVPRLSLDAWHRDGAVLGGVVGPLVDVLGGFRGYAEALRVDEVGLVAMDDGEYQTAGERFASAAEAVGAAHRRLARAKADGAQGFASYAVPIRRRCEPFRRAFATQVEAARAAAEGEHDRAETLGGKAFDRILDAELEHPLPEPEDGSSGNESGAVSGVGSG